MLRCSLPDPAIYFAMCVFLVWVLAHSCSKSGDCHTVWLWTDQILALMTSLFQASGFKRSEVRIGGVLVSREVEGLYKS